MHKKRAVSDARGCCAALLLHEVAASQSSEYAQDLGSHSCVMLRACLWCVCLSAASGQDDVHKQ